MEGGGGAGGRSAEVQCNEAAASTAPQQHFRVGCALLPKKVSRYLTPSMKCAAAEAGIELCQIDCNKPLSEQGPFNAIVHKLQPSKEWECSLQDYAAANPHVRVIDSVDGIRMLRNRATMLSVLEGRGIVMQQAQGDAPSSTARVCAPVQVEIPEDMPLEEAELLLAQSGMRPPFLVKPVWTDGREGSHGLAVVHDLGSLSKLLSGAVSSSLGPPVVVQQFVEHGGVLHKVYVLGETTVVCKRPSLGDNYLGSNCAKRKGILQLPRISCTSHNQLTDLDRAGADVAELLPCSEAHESDPELVTPSSRPNSPDETCPPEWVTHSLARTLRKRLCMQLFNFDLICPEVQPRSNGGEKLYLVVDINFFPGISKLPNFEEVFVQFLQATCAGSTPAASPALASLHGSSPGL